MAANFAKILGVAWLALFLDRLGKARLECAAVAGDEASAFSLGKKSWSVLPIMAAHGMPRNLAGAVQQNEAAGHKSLANTTAGMFSPCW